MEQIKVRVVGNVSVPLDNGKEILPSDGVVEVNATVYVKRRILDGDLERVQDDAAAGQANTVKGKK